jgi:hypothetical protein
MCCWVKFREDENEKIMREVPVHAGTENDARDIFLKEFPAFSHLELISP